MIDGEKLVHRDVPRNYLWVEGNDDFHVCIQLLKQYQISEGIVEIVKKEGIENILRDLKVQLLESGETRLGIIVDADEDFTSRWHSIQNILLGLGYNVPASPQKTGTVIQHADFSTVGFWIMPDNNTPGIIEDFFRFLVPTGDVLWPLAVKTIEEVILIDRRFPLVHKSKALAHTWLSWQAKPQTTLGQAIKSHYVNANAPQAQHFINWMRQLFDLPPVK